MYPDDLRYTENHQWARKEDGVVTVGITHYAQSQLGDLVYVELPGVGDEVSAGDGVASVESVKAVADVNTPVSGKVVEVNVVEETVSVELENQAIVEVSGAELGEMAQSRGRPSSQRRSRRRRRTRS